VRGGRWRCIFRARGGRGRVYASAQGETGAERPLALPPLVMTTCPRMPWDLRAGAAHQLEMSKTATLVFDSADEVAGPVATSARIPPERARRAVLRAYREMRLARIRSPDRSIEVGVAAAGKVVGEG